MRNDLATKEFIVLKTCSSYHCKTETNYKLANIVKRQFPFLISLAHVTEEKGKCRYTSSSLGLHLMPDSQVF